MKRKGGGVDRVASLRKSIDSSESEKWQVSKRPFCKVSSLNPGRHSQERALILYSSQLLLDNYAGTLLRPCHQSAQRSQAQSLLLLAAPILYGFVREVAYYMAENHYRNPHSHLSPEIWLGFEHWQSLVSRFLLGRAIVP